MRFLTALLALALPYAAAAQDNVFTPRHVAKLRAITEAIISPDGTQVAYVLGVPRDLAKDKDGPAWTELHVVDADGNSTPFITGPVNIGSIAWTPDGKGIAFLTKRDKDTTRSLYVIGVKGGEARKLQAHASDIQGYSFSGDGKQVAFLAAEPAPAARKKLNEQGFNQEVYEEDQPFVRVWVADFRGPKGSDAQPDAAAVRKLELAGSASELHFHPKDDVLAVALAQTPAIDDNLMFRKVHIVEFQSRDPKAAAVVKSTNLDNPGKLGQLAWSPDGTKLAMITGKDKHDPKEGRLWIHARGGKSWTKLEEGTIWHVESIAWKNASNVAYQFSQDVSTGAMEVGKTQTPQGSAETRTPFATTEDKMLSSLTISRDGKTCSFIGHTMKHPPEVYIQGASDKEPRRLTDSNPWLKTMRFAKQEVIKYRARDGLELQGVLIRPLDEAPDKRYPLVLTVHGGPESHYSNGWLTHYHSLGQVGAARGMAVFYPNYRGSTGRGVEFSMKGQRAAAGKEFDDLVDGVDHLVGMGLVNNTKVGITGGSYGGYATAWGATYHSHRFAAGVMFVGLSDLVSCAGTTDIPQEMFLVHHRQWLWDNWDYHLNASPIKHVDRHKTPLLILHGKDDPRVHPSQSLELYRHLKVRDQAPVRLVLYPGEGHGNRRAASRLDYNIRLLQWMEHYLKGPGGKMPALEIDYGLMPPATTRLGWDNRTTVAAQHEPRPDHPWLDHRWLDQTALGRECPCCIGW